MATIGSPITGGTCLTNKCEHNGNAQHWLKRTFFDPETRKADTFAQTTTFRCNEWLDEQDRQRYLDLYKTNPRRAKVAADGDWGVSEGLVFEDNVELVDFDPQEKLTECGHAGFGLDYGFGGDPNAFVALAIDPKSKNIWIYDEMYTYHQTTPHIAEWLKKNGYQHANIYADSASPERTQQLLDLDIDNIQSVVKTPIEAGIDQLWQYKIHVHPKCKNIWNEFNNYVFDTDNIGNTLNRPKDENNHAIDALRYACRQYMDMYDGSMGVDWGNQYHIAREMGLDI